MHADVLILGAGAAGGAVARALAPTGKSILLLNREAFLPREAENWSPDLVYRRERYKTEDRWRDTLSDTDFRASMIYHVGGNTKTYGAAMLRMRPEDFGAVQTEDGLSPAWPISYDDLAPYYDRADADYFVHGERGSDPFEPPAGPYPHPALAHDPRIGEVGEKLRSVGLKPFALPMALLRNPEQDAGGPFVLRELFRAQGQETFDGYPDLTLLKADAETCGVRPALDYDNVALRTGVTVTRLVASASGREITGVEAEIDGQRTTFSGDVVVLACGAVNTADLLLRSEVANGSDRVGRHYMRHITSKFYSVDTRTPNETYFQKTLAVNDYYWGDGAHVGPGDGGTPLGHVHLMGKHLPAMIGADLKLSDDEAEAVSRHSLDWWVQGEDLPLAENRVRLGVGGRIEIDYRLTNEGAHARLMDLFEEKLRAVGFDRFFRVPMPLRVMNHQCGTARMSADPADGVVDPNGRSHEVDNLWIADASVFPSSAATNPTLTIVANAYRTAERIAEAL
ncbi:MAG: GMC family oxidoreductase [Bacteroidota bacterium]